jgi:NADPH:quinone reductase-like Zn-dependent oxidoreductase
MNQYETKALFSLIQVSNEWLTKLAQWLGQNNIKVNVKKTFSLDEVVTVLEYQEDVSPRGKIVLTL